MWHSATGKGTRPSSWEHRRLRLTTHSTLYFHQSTCQCPRIWRKPSSTASATTNKHKRQLTATFSSQLVTFGIYPTWRLCHHVAKTVVLPISPLLVFPPASLCIPVTCSSSCSFRGVFAKQPFYQQRLRQNRFQLYGTLSTTVNSAACGVPADVALISMAYPPSDGIASYVTHANSENQLHRPGGHYLSARRPRQKYMHSIENRRKALGAMTITADVAYVDICVPRTWPQYSCCNIQQMTLWR